MMMEAKKLRENVIPTRTRLESLMMVVKNLREKVVPKRPVFEDGGRKNYVKIRQGTWFYMVPTRG